MIIRFSNLQEPLLFRYDDANAASSAIDWFDGKDFNGNKIKVSLAQRNNAWQQKGGPKRGGFGGKFGKV